MKKIAFNLIDLSIAFTEMKWALYKGCPKCSPWEQWLPDTDFQSHSVAYTLPLVSSSRSQEKHKPSEHLEVSLVMSSQLKESGKTLFLEKAESPVEQSKSKIS